MGSLLWHPLLPAAPPLGKLHSGHSNQWVGLGNAGQDRSSPPERETLFVFLIYENASLKLEGSGEVKVAHQASSLVYSQSVQAAKWYKIANICF